MRRKNRGSGRQLQVSGILSPTGSQDDELLFTRLATAQMILNKPGKVSMVEVAALCTSLYPAVTAARLDPNEALRTVEMVDWERQY